MDISLQVSELRFATEDGVVVLDEVSFGVPRDGVAVIVGPPSSGKTLLLRLILRELPATGGQILLLGRNVARLSPRKVATLRRRVGYLPEEPVVLRNRTVIGNLLFKLRALGLDDEDTEERVSRALQLAEMADAGDRPAAELSPFEARKLALALALVTDPPLLLCDDPERGLDDVDAQLMIQLLMLLQRADIALVITTREQSTAARIRSCAGESTPIVQLRQEVMT